MNIYILLKGSVLTVFTFEMFSTDSNSFAHTLPSHKLSSWKKFTRMY